MRPMIPEQRMEQLQRGWKFIADHADSEIAVLRTRNVAILSAYVPFDPPKRSKLDAVEVCEVSL